LGEETFGRGIQHYLGNNQWKSLVAKDFLDAMDVGTGAAVSGAFSTFIDNPGTPVVGFALSCEAGKEPVLSLSQGRYKPLGSQISDSPDYKIPLCVRYPGADKKNPERECMVLSEKTSQMPLTKAVGCPAWVVPNAGATGYYRSKLSESLLAALLAKAPLSVPEELALASDLKALVHSGGAPIESMLALVPRMASSEDDGLIGTAADLSGLGMLVEDADQPRYKAWLSKTFGKRARRLGWKASPSDAPSRTALRSTLLALMVVSADDLKLRAEGQALAKAWLADPTSVNPDLAELALQVGARFGDAALLDQYVAAIKATSDRSRRRLLLQGLGAVTEPALVEHALQVMLDPDIDVRESQRMLVSIAGDKQSGHLAFAFVQANFDALSKRYGEEMGTRLARVASSQCDESHSDAVQQFLRDKIEPMDGGKRSAEQALESFQLCLAAKKQLSLPAKL
jgi:alanyl aminopeptidase